jgi:hypothetical protein
MTSSPLRLLGGLLVVVGLLAGVLSVRSDWLSATGVDFWNLPELYADLEQASRELVILEQRDKDVLSHMAAKRGVVRALRLGELSLFEAAARFGEINTQAPETMTFVRAMYPGDTDEERLCRQVLGWLEVDLWYGDDSNERATLARLQADFEAFLKKQEPAR